MNHTMTNDLPVGAGSDSSRVASALRLFGGGAVLLSAVLFMVQGIEHIGVDLRQWVYLLLTAGLGLCAVFVRRVLDDAKSARLCFALAAGALAVQVSQVAGMLHELIHPSTGFWLDFSGTTLATTLLTGGITAVLFAPLAYTAFSVLQRPVARTLTFAYALSSALLLLPVREGFGAVVVLAALSLLWFAVEQQVMKRQHTANTLEGYGARAILGLPVLIAVARYAFHVDSVIGVCALMIFVAVSFAGLAIAWIEKGGLRDLFLAIAVVVGGLAWMVMVDTWMVGSSTAENYLSLFPVALSLLLLGRYAGPLRGAFRLFAVMAGTLPAIAGIVDHNTFHNALLLTVAGGGFAAWGLTFRERETFVPGFAALVSGIVIVFAEALAHVEVSSWVSLAVGGVVLVIAASVLERHGAKLLTRVRGGWETVAQWR